MEKIHGGVTGQPTTSTPRIFDVVNRQKSLALGSTTQTYAVRISWLYFLSFVTHVGTQSFKQSNAADKLRNIITEIKLSVRSGVSKQML